MLVGYISVSARERSSARSPRILGTVPFYHTNRRAELPWRSWPRSSPILGFRLVARRYGLQMGFDIAAGPDNTVFYVVFGNAWLRP